jgi:1-aminocyclopropane-1-carboxylate deaminase/D-cysteine desulfhydrase-like pyridoxal-dependent ACC family enzyme
MTLSPDQLRMRLSRLPRARLAHLPTPVDACPRLSASLGRTVLIKRDDCTGLGLGGNKVRQHEFVLGDALAAGADCLIQGAAAQSNHSRQLAAAGARLGLDVFLLPKQDEFSHPVQGNYLIDHLLGATLVPIGRDESATARKRQLADDLRAQGRRPYVMGMGAERALALGAVAYVDALLEIMAAVEAPDWIVVTSQGSTQAGLQLGCELLGLPTKVIGICPMTHESEAYIDPAGIARLAQAAAAVIGVQTQITAGDIVSLTGYVGPRYGVASEASVAAINRLGAAEGILLDPVYSGKGFAGLLDLCERDVLPPGSRGLFVHTGGVPALFSHASALVPAAGAC